jgi:hypothetical protein
MTVTWRAELILERCALATGKAATALRRIRNACNLSAHWIHTSKVDANVLEKVRRERR